MTSFRELWEKFRRSFDLFIETFHGKDEERGGTLLRLGVLCVILSLAISVTFRVFLGNSLIPNTSFAVIAFLAIDLILGVIVIAAFLRTTGRIGLKFLVAAAVLVAFGIALWSSLSNAIA